MKGKMSKRPTHARRITLLTSTLSIAIATSFAAHGAEAWVTTKTKAYPLLPAKSAVNTGIGVKTNTNTKILDKEPVTITVSLKLRNEAQLDKQLEFLQSGGSRQFLTPAQFTAQYSPTQQQVDQVVAYLKKSGYSNITIAPNRLLVTAQGTAANVRTAFNTPLQQFQKDGKTVYANTADAQVPVSLSPLIDSVLGLQNASTFKTQSRIFSSEKISPASLAIYRASADPAFSTTSGIAADTRLSTNAKTVAPPPVATGHNPLAFSKIYNAQNTATASNTAVGIVSWGDATQSATDLKKFTFYNDLAPIPTEVINVGPGPFVGPDAEWSLDSQSIAGAAGGKVKKIIFYNAPSGNNVQILNTFNRAVTDNVVKVINASFGLYERFNDTRDAEAIVFKQAVAQGITISASTGDSGAYEESGGAFDGNNYTVSSPASSPYVIAVGGTTLLTDAANPNVYRSETVWNDEPEVIGSIIGISGTGGGYSKIEKAPSWQTKAITGSTKRALPDISFTADPSSGAKLFYGDKLVQYGGTSLSAPIFAGIWARLQSSSKNTLGFPATSLYKYLPQNPALLNDVLTGNNGYAAGGYPGYSAKAGWDAATGFGSLNIAKLDAFIKANPDFAK